MEKIIYSCDWCKKEIEKPFQIIRTETVRYDKRFRRAKIHLCEDCFNRLFKEYFPQWDEKDKELDDKRNAREMAHKLKE